LAPVESGGVLGTIPAAPLALPARTHRLSPHWASSGQQNEPQHFGALGVQ
jgi:hypothetical protein